MRSRFEKGRKGSSPGAPIGVYDSGVGGLTVLRELQKQLPGEEILYFGDTAHVPYGGRPAADILAFNRRILAFFSRHGVKLAVAACGTSSALALPTVAPEFPFPVFGLIGPAVHAALAATKNFRIGVIATEGTIASGAFERALRRLEPSIRTASQACPLFVPLVEGDFIDTEETKKTAQGYLEPLEKKNIDTLILGCTHYPHLSAVLQKILGKTVGLIDPGRSVAADVKKWLKEKGILRPESRAGTVQFFVSGSVARFQEVGGKLYGHPLGPVYCEAP